MPENKTNRMHLQNKGIYALEITKNTELICYYAPKHNN